MTRVECTQHVPVRHRIQTFRKTAVSPAVMSSETCATSTYLFLLSSRPKPYAPSLPNIIRLCTTLPSAYPAPPILARATAPSRPAPFDHVPRTVGCHTRRTLRATSHTQDGCHTCRMLRARSPRRCTILRLTPSRHAASEDLTAGLGALTRVQEDQRIM